MQGTLLALVSAMGFVDEETGDFPASKQAFAVDALSTMFGSIFGLSPVTSFIESGAGVEAGSRTGLTAVFCGIFFFLSIFFAPIIASIPPWATGGSLIIVGALMSRSLGKLKWHDPAHAVTAFLTVIVMPLTYSIGKRHKCRVDKLIGSLTCFFAAYGLIAGICCWIILQGTFFLFSLVGIERPDFGDGSEAETAPATDDAKKIDESSDSDPDQVMDQTEQVADETEQGQGDHYGRQESEVTA